jgi:hypothetical protein
MKCGVISRLKVVLLHGTEHLWSNFVLAHQICVSLICVCFVLLMQGDILEKAKILQSVKVNDVRTTQYVYNDQFFLKRSQTWLTGILIFTVVWKWKAEAWASSWPCKWNWAQKGISYWPYYDVVMPLCFSFAQLSFLNFWTIIHPFPRLVMLHL